MSKSKYEFLVVLNGKVHLGEGVLPDPVGAAVKQVHIELQNKIVDDYIKSGRSTKKVPVVKPRHHQREYRILAGASIALGIPYDDLHLLPNSMFPGLKPKGDFIMRLVKDISELDGREWAKRALEDLNLPVAV